MSATQVRVRTKVKHLAPEIASVASVLAAASVIVHYKHKYSGEVLFTVPQATMQLLHREGAAVLQDLGHGRYTLAPPPIF